MNKKILFIFSIILLFQIAYALDLGDVSDSFSNFFSNIFKRFFSSQTTPTVSCSSCNVGSCSCSVSDCSSGLFNIYTLSDCSSTPTYNFVFSGSTKTWSPESSGNYYVKILCDDGSKSACSPIIVGGSGSTTSTTVQVSGTTTTTTFSPINEVEVSSVSCTRDECRLNVNRNSLGEGLVIFFELVDDDGKVYYSSNLNLEPNVTGEKKMIMSRLRPCPSGTELEFLALIFRRSDLNSRVYRVTDETFTC